MEKLIKILVVDGSAETRALLVSHLEKEVGMTVVGDTSNGLEVQALVEKHQPDVLLMEVILPGLDGLSVLKQLKNNCIVKIPVVILLSYFLNEKIISEASQLGAQSFILKPYYMNCLLEQIRSFCGRTENIEENKRPLQQENLETNVANILREIGVPAHIMGYGYLRAAIMLAVNDRKVINAVTKILYPSIANTFNSTTSRVERAIRHAIEVACDRGDMITLQRYFGYTISTAKGKPTNSEFIAIIADKIQLQQNSVS